TLGRFMAGVIVSRTSVSRLLQVCAFGLAGGAMLLTLKISLFLSFFGVVLMGLAAAPVFPSLISTTPGRVGVEHTAKAVGFQIGAAVLGQSLLPALIGVFARRLGLEILGPTLLASAVCLLVLFETLSRISVRPTDQFAKARHV